MPLLLEHHSMQAQSQELAEVGRAISLPASHLTPWVGRVQGGCYADGWEYQAFISLVYTCKSAADSSVFDSSS